MLVEKLELSETSTKEIYKMEKKLYKEVSVTDRLPQRSGYYLTNNGKRIFSDHINVWQRKDNEGPVEWWLDVVKLPSEKEINKVRDSYSWCHINPVFKSGWRYGVKYILERLKGGKHE